MLTATQLCLVHSNRLGAAGACVAGDDERGYGGHLEIRAKTLANLEVDGKASGKPGKKDAGVMGFLRTFSLDSLCCAGLAPRSVEWRAAQADAT
jgi:hypothetical protein